MGKGHGGSGGGAGGAGGGAAASAAAAAKASNDARSMAFNTQVSKKGTMELDRGSGGVIDEGRSAS